MLRTKLLVLAVVTLAGTLGADCGEPRPPRPDARIPAALPGSCDGLVDYGDEFEVTFLQNAGMSLLGFGVIEVDIDIEVRNLGDAHFQAASVLPDLSDAADLGVIASPAPLAAEFGEIDPGATVQSSVPLRLQIPAVHYGDLISRLGNGTIPLSVYADEVNELAPGVEIHDWTAVEDRMYYVASQPNGGFGGPLNADPGPGPFAQGEEFGVVFIELLDDQSSVFDDFAPGELFYLVENPESPFGGENENVPDAYDRVRVVDAVRFDEEDDDITIWIATLKRTDTESLAEIWSTASFCSHEFTEIDLPVQESRLGYRDNHAQAPETSDAKPQGIRFNDLPFANGLVTLSGQVQGHVLAPSLSFRIRDGRVSTGADFDTDLALTAELRAEDSASFAPEDLELWSLCFPLPDLVFGPVTVAMNLQLVHTLGVEADVQAGAVVGFEKHFDSGFSIWCESGGGGGSSCDSEGHRSDTPIEFTPPRLTDDTAAHARVETTIESSLNFFSPYPFCETGPGLFLAATAHGSLDVTPTADPWWGVEYGLDVTAGAELDVLGLAIGRYDTNLFTRTDDGPDSGVGGERSSGEDQRWAVAIDDTQVPNGVSATKITALPDGSSVAIASEAIFGRTPLVKLDPWGAMQWVKEFVSGKVPQRVRALPDGTLIVVGTNSWLARVDADGNLLWSFDAEVSRDDFASARCALYDVAPIETAPGHYDFVAVGRMGASIVTQNDACALRANEDGTLAWARLYEGERVQTFHGVTPMRDGNVMAVGTDAWYWVGTRAIPLFAKLDPANGDVIWWKGMPMTRLASLNAVTEAADGTLYAVGATSGIIYTTGTAIVARIAPDGSDAYHAEIYQDESWEELLDFETWTDTAGGDTPYDAYFDIAPSGDGFVVVGNTGLGVETAARAAKINPALGTEWITTFDGAAVDGLSGVAPASDGIFVSGYSASLPEADGGSGENQLWVMKLPFTGSLDFLPEVAMTTRFVAPAVRDSTLDPAVNPTDAVTIDNPYAVEDAVILSAGPNAGLLVTASPYCVEKLTETGRTTTTDACPDP